MKEYRVLWFDDEFEGDAGLRQIQDRALRNDIILEGVTNAEVGLARLTANVGFYDAVLTDGLFHVRQEDKGTAVTQEALMMVSRKLDELKPIKQFPAFLLSGQESIFKALENEHSIVSMFYNNRSYDKLQAIEPDFDLWDDIKRACDEQPDVQLKHTFQNALAVCTETYIGDAAYNKLFPLLKALRQQNQSFNDVPYYNQLRHIVEHLFRGCEKYGFLHSDCLRGGTVNISESFKFLSGQPCKYLPIKCAKSHFPELVASLLDNIIAISNSGSHTNDEDVRKVNLEEYKKGIKTPFLLYSLVYQVIDVLIWFKDYADNNQDVTINRSHWLDLGSEETVEGVIEEDSHGNYHCGEFLLQYGKVNGVYSVGTRIVVTKHVPNTNSRAPQFKYFVIGFDVI